MIPQSKPAVLDSKGKTIPSVAIRLGKGWFLVVKDKLPDGYKISKCEKLRVVMIHEVKGEK